MAICAVIDLNTNKQVNIIVADPSDIAPNGCKLIEIPEGCYWNGSEVIPYEVNNGD